jgi:type III pantothenate kinase
MATWSASLAATSLWKNDENKSGKRKSGKAETTRAVSAFPPSRLPLCTLMILLFDIGNTHTHVGLADGKRVVKQTDISTLTWFGGGAAALVKKFAGPAKIEGAILCSVVPRATPFAKKFVRLAWKLDALELNAKTIRGVGIDYPKPASIGPDRLANAVAARDRFGAPVVVLDFGTAVTFDVVDAKGNYVGGIIAPGLAAMTNYLHEKTALLPKIEIREIKTAIGKSTEEAMLVGAVHGYRGLVRELIAELKRELRVKKLPVVATGGYAKLIAAKLPEISAVEPDLTLEGLRLVWLAK